MSYRATPSRCFICEGTPVLRRCARCDRPLCMAHVHGPEDRCERCELAWVDPLRGMRVVGPRLLALLIVGLMTTLFITASAASTNHWSPEIEQIKWTGGAVALVLIGVLGMTQLWPALRFVAVRRRFLAERRVQTARLRVNTAREEAAREQDDDRSAPITQTAFGIWRTPPSSRPRVDGSPRLS